MDYKEIKSFEDACKAPHCNFNPSALPDVSTLPQEFQSTVINNYKRMVITKAINPEGYQPNWHDHSELKYYPWMEVETERDDKINSAGFGFSGDACVYGCSGTVVGSRLCFSDEDRCMYFIENFKDILIETLLIR